MTETGNPRAPATPAPPAPSDAYHPDAVESKWQSRWAERRINEPDHAPGAKLALEQVALGERLLQVLRKLGHEMID